MEAAGLAEAATASAGPKPSSGHLEPASILASEIVSATISAATAPSFSKSLEKCFSSGARPRPRLFQSQPLPHTEVSNTKNPPKICAYNNLKKKINILRLQSPEMKNVQNVHEKETKLNSEFLLTKSSGIIS